MEPPFNVLCLCTGTQLVRYMAEPILNREGRGSFQEPSAAASRKGQVDPETSIRSSELKFDVSVLRSKKLGENSAERYARPPLDFVLTVCENAAGEAVPYRPEQLINAPSGVPTRRRDRQRSEIRPAFADAFRTLSNESPPSSGCCCAARQADAGSANSTRSGESERFRQRDPPSLCWPKGWARDLVATVIGSGIMAARLAVVNEAMALLANTIATGGELVVSSPSSRQGRARISTPWDVAFAAAGDWRMARGAGLGRGAKRRRHRRLDRAHPMFDLLMLEIGATRAPAAQGPPRRWRRSGCCW